MNAPHTLTDDYRLIAILRGITPSEIPAIVGCLLDTGFRAIEIPLNSPQPFDSIEQAVRVAESHNAERCLVGAGTVLNRDDVATVRSCGGDLIVSPNINPDVVSEAVRLGMVCLPGVFTASEAHLAIAAGASGLKFFPAFKLGADGISAIAATLPDGIRLYAVGGVSPTDFGHYLQHGVFGFGLGSNLYRPGSTLADVESRAKQAQISLSQSD